MQLTENWWDLPGSSLLDFGSESSSELAWQEGFILGILPVFLAKVSL